MCTWSAWWTRDECEEDYNPEGKSVTKSWNQVGAFHGRLVFQRNCSAGFSSPVIASPPNSNCSDKPVIRWNGLVTAVSVWTSDGADEQCSVRGILSGGAPNSLLGLLTIYGVSSG